MAEDWDVWLRIAQHYDIRSIETPLVKYRFHERNFSESSGEINLTNELQFLNRIFSEEAFKHRKLTKRRTFASRYIAAAKAFKKSQQRTRVKQCVLKAFSTYPPIALSKAAWGLAWYAIRPTPRRDARDQQKGSSQP
jgi:hypothetical protein